MKSGKTTFYQAYVARDARFDGVVYVGIKSKNIYCRPICLSTAPQEDCQFFSSAAAAEKATFRPCMQCRPELAPGVARLGDAYHMSCCVLGSFLDGWNPQQQVLLETLGKRFEQDTQQVQHTIQDALGVSPMELLQTHRLLFALLLLRDTLISLHSVAYASGFESLKALRDVFLKHYHTTPDHYRKKMLLDFPDTSIKNPAFITLQLAYRPPFNWMGILDFLKGRILAGVESIESGIYARTIQIRNKRGYIRVWHDTMDQVVRVEASSTLIPVLAMILSRLRYLFDLDAEPVRISEDLSRDTILRRLLKQNPGLRVPGAFDGMELAVRAILGQQVNVRVATVFSGRLVAALGDPIITGNQALTHTFPTPQRLASATISELVTLGIVERRARSIIALSEEISMGRLHVGVDGSPEIIMRKLLKIPGIGPWTAHYIAMRALCWGDAFPKEDIGLRNKLGGVTIAEVEKIAEKWRPWRSYATLHIWQNSGEPLDYLNKTTDQNKRRGLMTTQETIKFTIRESRFGPVLIAQSDQGICAIFLGDDPHIEQENLQRAFPKAQLEHDTAALKEIAAQVVHFIENPREGLSLPLDIRGTEFQKKVWKVMRQVPVGETISYGEIARKLDIPKSVRAVARAAASNRHAVVIPCHRVLRGDGSISGYRWGVGRKWKLLQNEGVILDKSESQIKIAKEHKCEGTSQVTHPRAR